MLKIEGPQFQGYDAGHLQIIRQELARSIKPNIFKNMNEEVAIALLLTDAVELSPAAKEILRKLRKQMSGHPQIGSMRDEDDIQELIYTLRQLRKAVYGKEEEEVEGEPVDVNVPKVIPLSRKKGKRSPARGPRDGRVADILEKMIVYAPSRDKKLSLMRELEIMGEKFLNTVRKFGVKIIILPRNQALTDLKIAGMHVVTRQEKTFDGRPWSSVRGIYDQGRRLVVLGEERIGTPYSSAARHELAHAYDHTFSSQHGRRLPLSVQLWNMFRKTRGSLISDYAGVNPQEYFAECVENFFNPTGKEKLAEQDPQMFQYLQALFDLE
ncbi:MAG: zinc-dependent peptidase [Candidatus Eremiobacteraeota bacterium]|nr:zinc-dependent peptidase [Candidatus Eremiobacteraeota bacterium]